MTQFKSGDRVEWDDANYGRPCVRTGVVTGGNASMGWLNVRPDDKAYDIGMSTDKVRLTRRPHPQNLMRVK